MICVWLAQGWDKKRSLAVLQKYYAGNDKDEKTIAADIIAEIE